GHLLDPPDLSMVPEEDRLAVARALAKTPTDRWPSCRAFVAALREKAAASTSPASRPPYDPGKGPRSGRVLMVISLGVACLLLAGGLAWPSGLFDFRRVLPVGPPESPDPPVPGPEIGPLPTTPDMVSDVPAPPEAIISVGEPAGIVAPPVVMVEKEPHLNVEVPDIVVLKAGESTKLTITVQRDHVAGLVHLDFQGLPQGVLIRQPAAPGETVMEVTAIATATVG